MSCAGDSVWLPLLAIVVGSAICWLLARARHRRDDYVCVKAVTFVDWDYAHADVICRGTEEQCLRRKALEAQVEHQLIDFGEVDEGIVAVLPTKEWTALRGKLDG